MKSFFFALFLLLTTLTQGIAQSIDVAKIDQLLESKIKTGAPGLAVGIVKNGAIVYERYLGLSNLQHQIPVDPQTRFNLASVAKQFTALCVLKLVLENKLSLEADIRQYLPQIYPHLKTPIPIKTLLNHSSGIRDFYDLLSISGKPWWRQEGLDNEDALALLLKQKDLNFAPGTERWYSNSNYTLLAEIVARVSGTPFPEYAKQLFIDLGMPHTQFCTNYMQVIPFQALPYNDWGDGSWQQYPMMTNLYADGFLYTTLKDQLVFEQAIQKTSTQANSLLNSSQKPIPNTTIQDYGYGLEISPINGYPAVHHAGSTGSYNAQTLRFPSEKLSIMVLSNNGNLWSGGIAREVATQILGRKAAELAYATRPLQVQAASTPGDLVGQYRSSENNIIRIQLKEGSLYWQMDNNNPRKLIRETGNLYHWDIDEDWKVSFNHRPDSTSTMALYTKTEEPLLLKKLPPFAPSDAYLQACVGRYYSTELDLNFSIKLSPEKGLVFKREGGKNDINIEVVQKGELLASDYKMSLETEATGRVIAVLMTYNRVRNLRFEKVE
ncbi:MAG TPA: serine hydrolase domain-containing protein [Haliscomenobacter sp.]|uniref:serine hydrolase domain-containing protein n=1 Tax=Haliscomenobacter sp. TaxID=2717303 RepID=UPI002BE6B498|nr:serine hydrolase domain-containing protein [Haliscomenobacter sp.]HOY17749.1 serine hydrolase domain-containing protein [Haliscomenobacter sp.]HPH18005.1 serine hydrolase domain-containing protein [Haliscomenobacter sp.]